MRIIEYADAYSYACGIAPHKYKQTVYSAMRPHFKIMLTNDITSFYRLQVLWS
jgi:hypothetical protein